MCLNFEKGYMLSEGDLLHIMIFFIVSIETLPPEVCITNEFKSRECLYMWFRLDFETFLARMSQIENRQVLFIFSMWFDLELHE